MLRLLIHQASLTAFRRDQTVTFLEIQWSFSVYVFVFCFVNVEAVNPPSLADSLQERDQAVTYREMSVVILSPVILLHWSVTGDGRSTV